MESLHTKVGQCQVEMTHEVSRNITLEDDNLGFVVFLEPSDKIGQSILRVLVPEVAKRL